MKISIALVTLALVVASLASGEFVPQQGSQTSKLLKRSLCNTFGGCGAKRSIVPHYGNQHRQQQTGSGGSLDEQGDESSRSEANAKLISEILEAIIEHLQRDQNYKQGRYVMFVPKQASDGTSYLQRLDADSMNPAMAQQVASSFRDEELSAKLSS